MINDPQAELDAKLQERIRPEPEPAEQQAELPAPKAASPGSAKPTGTMERVNRLTSPDAGKPASTGPTQLRQPQDVPIFNRMSMNMAKRQMGLAGVAVPRWATRNPERFNLWMQSQVRKFNR